MHNRYTIKKQKGNKKMSDNSDTEKKSSSNPMPEPLKVKSASVPVADESKESLASKTNPVARRRVTYRPSHKATFIGISVILGILVINAVVIGFVLNGQSSSKDSTNKAQLTISTDELDQLGVNRSTVGNSGTELKIGPNTSFSGDVSVAGNTSIAGQLSTNNKLSAPIASLTKLDAGDTTLDTLSVNGDATVTNLNLRGGITVTGSSSLQGTLTVSQLFTVNNNVNVAGNISIGGVLSVNQLHVASLVSDASLTIGGHVITVGNAPSISAGPAIGSNGTVSISGNDISGTIAANMGVGGGNGTILSITFRSPYSNTPHIIITPVGRNPGDFYINRSAAGFSIVITGTGPGSCAFDYIVMQ